MLNAADQAESFKQFEIRNAKWVTFFVKFFIYNFAASHIWKTTSKLSFQY